MPDLKLLALDTEDLGVVSTHLQDAVVRVGDMAYLKSDKRFAAVVNRFDWFDAEQGHKRSRGASYERRRTGLRFERVMSAQVSAVNFDKPDDVLSLLAIGFDATEAPAGDITLHFAGGAAIKLAVECIECELRDLGAAWATQRKPDHT